MASPRMCENVLQAPIVWSCHNIDVHFSGRIKKNPLSAAATSVEEALNNSGATHHILII